MKILIDECVPRKFKASLSPHECLTVPEAGLAGKKNGELLRLAQEQGFQIFVTVDKGIQHEHGLIGSRLAIILLRAKTSFGISCPMRKHAFVRFKR